jgi:hypothetical protein
VVEADDACSEAEAVPARVVAASDTTHADSGVVVSSI